MHARFTRLAVQTNPKSKVLTAVYPEIRDGQVVGISPLFAAPIPLKASMRCVTASAHGSAAFRLVETGSVYSIAVKDVPVREIETLGSLFLRNPWKNEKAQLFVAAFQK